MNQVDIVVWETVGGLGAHSGSFTLVHWLGMCSSVMVMPKHSDVGQESKRLNGLSG